MTRDPVGRVVRQEWSTCGTLDALIDGSGHKTTWEWDDAGRLHREVRADASARLYGYETTTSRLKTVTDPESQVTTFSYEAIRHPKPPLVCESK